MFKRTRLIYTVRVPPLSEKEQNSCAWLPCPATDALLGTQARQQRSIRQGMADEIRLVYAGPIKGAIPLRRIAEGAGWRLEECKNWKRALELAERLQATVFIYDRDANPSEWPEALRQSLDRTQPPAFLLISRFADESMWAELLVNSGYDLLLAPLEPADVVRTVEAAHEHHLRAAVANA